MFNITLAPVSAFNIVLDNYPITITTKPYFNIELREASSFNISLYSIPYVPPSNNIVTFSGKGIIMRIGKGTNPVTIFNS